MKKLFKRIKEYFTPNHWVKVYSKDVVYSKGNGIQIGMVLFVVYEPTKKIYTSYLSNGMGYRIDVDMNWIVTNYPGAQEEIIEAIKYV